jgi:hypothetical protein
MTGEMGKGGGCGAKSYDREKYLFILGYSNTGMTVDMHSKPTILYCRIRIYK